MMLKMVRSTLAVVAVVVLTQAVPAEAAERDQLATSPTGLCRILPSWCK